MILQFSMSCMGGTAVLLQVPNNCRLLIWNIQFCRNCKCAHVIKMLYRKYSRWSILVARGMYHHSYSYSFLPLLTPASAQLIVRSTQSTSITTLQTHFPSQINIKRRFSHSKTSIHSPKHQLLNGWQNVMGKIPNFTSFKSTFKMKLNTHR